MALTTTLLSLRRRLLDVTEKLGFLAPLLLRLTAGCAFIQTGWGKLNNLGGTTEFFASLGIPMPGLNAAVASSTEFFGGILLVIGLGTRLAALPMAFTMVVAIITAKRGDIEGVMSFFALDEMVYLAMFAALALIGPGAASLDALITKLLARKEATSAAAPLPAGRPAAAVR